MIGDHGRAPLVIIFVRDDVIVVHLLDDLIDAPRRIVLLREGEVVLMDLEGNARGRDDDVLDAVHHLEHPHVIRVVGAGVSQEHAIKAVHEVVTTVKKRSERCQCKMQESLCTISKLL